MMSSISRAAAAAKRLTDLRGDDEPDTEPAERAAPVEPTESTELHVLSLAVRSDGRVLLSVTHLAGADLGAREQWTGVVLREDETRGILERLSDTCDEAAGYVAGRILWSGKKGESGGSEGGDRG